MVRKDGKVDVVTDLSKQKVNQPFPNIKQKLSLVMVSFPNQTIPAPATSVPPVQPDPVRTKLDLLGDVVIIREMNEKRHILTNRSLE